MRFDVVVDVRLRGGIADPAGATIERALPALGYEGVTEVSVGKTVRFTIEASGRVSGCRISRSSGDAALDSTTCRLIEARFRFRPATNARGEPVASPYGWRQSWWLEPRH